MDGILAIDIGSNTIKCLLGRARGGEVERVFERTAQARISAGRGRLVAGAAEIISEAAAAFEAEARGFGENFSTVAVATSAMRDSPQGPQVAAEVFRRCGVRVQILDGRSEARLSFLGAMSDPLIDSSLPCAYFDLGGGSLEVVFGRGGEVGRSASMPIGAVNLAREFLKDPRAPVSERDARAIEERARAAIDAGLDFPIPDNGGALCEKGARARRRGKQNIAFADARAPWRRLRARRRGAQTGVRRGRRQNRHSSCGFRVHLRAHGKTRRAGNRPHVLQSEVRAGAFVLRRVRLRTRRKRKRDCYSRPKNSRASPSPKE